VAVGAEGTADPEGVLADDMAAAEGNAVDVLESPAMQDAGGTDESEPQPTPHKLAVEVTDRPVEIRIKPGDVTCVVAVSHLPAALTKADFPPSTPFHILDAA
jgi:hypothetical protein